VAVIGHRRAPREPISTFPPRGARPKPSRPGPEPPAPALRSLLAHDPIGHVRTDAELAEVREGDAEPRHCVDGYTCSWIDASNTCREVPPLVCLG